MSLFAVSYQNLPNITWDRIGSVQISSRALEGERIRGVTRNGFVPDVVGSESLSERIDEIIDYMAGNGTGTVELSYKIVRSTDVSTIIFLAESVTAVGSRSAKVATLAIDRESLEPTAISDLLGGNGLKIATDVVNNFIAQNFRNMPRIPLLDEDAHFYVTNDAVYFVFDRYEIAPGSEGIQSVPVYFNNLEWYWLEEEDFYINVENHGVRMLPLRRLAEHFDYYLDWNPDTHEITLTREGDGDNSNGVITLRLNENAYKRMHDLTPRALESAPEIINGVTFVPISFFESILDIHYNILANGIIELTTYQH